jgi:protein-tyrosine phosphatase
MVTSVTASAFTGHFGGVVKRFAFELLRRGLVHSVASDAHDAVRRPPALATELAKAGLGDHAPRASHEVPAAILRGSDIPAPPPLPLSMPARLVRAARRFTTIGW